MKATSAVITERESKDIFHLLINVKEENTNTSSE